jgi:hypothetical protein
MKELHACASRKCGRALSISHSVSQSVSMRDYYINKVFFVKNSLSDGASLKIPSLTRKYEASAGLPVAVG